MNFEFGIACTICSSIGSFLGTIIIQRLIAVSKRNSYLIFVLGFVLLISTILIPSHTLIQTLDQYQRGNNIFSFNQPC